MSERVFGPVENTLTAALYFDSAPEPVRIRSEWLNAITVLLERTAIPIRQAEVVGVARRVANQMPDYAEDKVVIEAAVAAGGVPRMALYGADLPQENLVLECDSSFHFKGDWGVVSIGWPAKLGPTPSQILRSLHTAMTGLPSIGYGIAFVRSNQLAPSFYACGTNGAGSRNPRLPYAVKDRIGKFFQQVQSHKRHLVDGFRSIYPAQILNDRHREVLVEGTRVADLPFGQWEQLPDGLWLWELSDAEVAEAMALFEHSGLLLAA